MTSSTGLREAPDPFYDELADSYHLLFENWEQSIRRQAGILGPIVELYTGRRSASILDCACGIGTQTLGLALKGHRLTASDISSAAVQRLAREAQARSLEIPASVADMRDLTSIAGGPFDVVLAADNALPHLLSQQDLDVALQSIASKLSADGVFIATVRPYDRLVISRPTMQPPAVFSNDAGETRIVHQVWHWHGTLYTLHLYLTQQRGTGWTTQHFCSTYRALLRSDLDAALRHGGLSHIEWLEEQTTGFYQGIVVASAVQLRTSHTQGLPA